MCLGACMCLGAAQNACLHVPACACGACAGWVPSCSRDDAPCLVVLLVMELDGVLLAVGSDQLGRQQECPAATSWCCSGILPPTSAPHIHAIPTCQCNTKQRATASDLALLPSCRALSVRARAQRRAIPRRGVLDVQDGGRADTQCHSGPGLLRHPLLWRGHAGGVGWGQALQAGGTAHGHCVCCCCWMAWSNADACNIARTVRLRGRQLHHHPPLTEH
jgi:hypothetical protein